MSVARAVKEVIFFSLHSFLCFLSRLVRLSVFIYFPRSYRLLRRVKCHVSQLFRRVVQHTLSLSLD